MNIPCLFITWNRLAYTKQALQSLLESDVSEIFIWDNNSEDGTREYLSMLSEPKIISTHFSHTNLGIRTPMNWFIACTADYQVVAKVDNDTLIPKDFCERMLPHMKYADIVQAKHHIIEDTCPGGWDNFIRPMRKSGELCFNYFVGGSGVLIKRSVMSDLPSTEWILYSWVTWQKQHPAVIKAFAKDVEIKLLDEKGYNDYPDYYKLTKRIK